MEKDRDKEKTHWHFWNAIRGWVDSSDYLAAAVLTYEVAEKYSYRINVSAEKLYSELLKAADSLHLANPFKNESEFQKVYQIGVELGDLDWEQAIAFANDARPMYARPMNALVSIMFEHIKDRQSKILIAEAEKFVPHLKQLVDQHSDSNFVFTVQQPLYARALGYVFDEYNNVKILTSSIYDYEFCDKNFDFIFSCPAFGGRVQSENGKFMCRELDMVAFENLSLHLSAGGQLMIILPGKIAFSTGKINDLRQHMQSNYSIKEISELPEGCISHTSIKVYLVVLENSKPASEDIIIRRYSSGEKKSRRSEIKSLEIGEEKFVKLGELVEQGNWNIDQIFAEQDEEYLNFQNSNVHKDSLGNVAQIFRGKTITKKEESGNIGVINISSIGDYDIDYAKIDFIQEEERKIANYLLEEGDLLLPARGTAIRTAVYHKQNFPCIASSNLIVIRPNAECLNSTFLKIFLDSSLGNKAISRAQQGTFVMNISYKDLCAVEIPVPPLPEQQEKVREYLEEYQNYRDTVKVAEARWKNVLKTLQNF